MSSKRGLLVEHPTEKDVVIRLNKDGEINYGILVPVEEGETIKGEVVTLHETPLSPYVHECETIFDPNDYGISVGPPKVTSQSYRNNWDHTFGKPNRKSLVN